MKPDAHDAVEMTLPVAGVMTAATTLLVVVLGMAIRLVLSLRAGGRTGTNL